MRGTLTDLNNNASKPEFIMELFSPPQVTLSADQYGFKSAGALDLETGWDADRPEDVVVMWDTLETTKPYLVIMPPRVASFPFCRI